VQSLKVRRRFQKGSVFLTRVCLAASEVVEVQKGREESGP